MFRNKEFDEVFGRVMIGIKAGAARYGLGLAPIEDANSLMAEMRIRKTEEEVEQMRKAAVISAEALSK